MLLSPLLSYITFGLMGLVSITYYFMIFTFFYGILFTIIKGQTIKIPRMLYLLILYSVYISIWGFYNGELERRGLFQVIINKQFTSIIFIIIIIYNTNFSARFIKRSISIIKITVILAAICSIIQVMDFSFMDTNDLWEKADVGDTFIRGLYQDRRLSIFGYVNQNEMGLSYIPLLSVLIGILLHQRYRFYYVFLLLGGITAFLSNNRYVMVAFILITFQVLFVQKKKVLGLMKYFISISIGVLLLLQTLSYLGYDFVDWYHDRLLSEGSLQETTRYKAIGIFLTYFPQNIFFGVGVHMTTEIEMAANAIGSSQIHVGYLAHLVSYGIVGSFFLFGFWFFLAKKLYKTAKHTNYWGSFLAFLTFLWANATLVFYSIFFYGIIFALVFDKFLEDKKSSLYTKV